MRTLKRRERRAPVVERELQVASTRELARALEDFLRVLVQVR